MLLLLSCLVYLCVLSVWYLITNYRCEEEDKDAYLYYLLSVHGQGRTIVFCTSVAALRHICALLKILGVDVCKLNADMKQQARLKVKTIPQNIQI